MSTKHDSDAKKVFEMVQNLKNRFGMNQEPAADETVDDLDLPQAEEPLVSPEIEEIEEAPATEEPEEESLEKVEEPELNDDEPEVMEESEDDEENGPTAEELTQAIDLALQSESSEEEPATPTEDLVEEEPLEETLAEDLIYEEQEINDEEDSKEEEETVEEANDGVENQIAIDVPEAEEPELPEEEVEEGSLGDPSVPAVAEPIPAPTPAEPQSAATEDFHPIHREPLPGKQQKPIAAEQLSLVNPPVMKAEGMAKVEEAPSIETLERSVPDLSKLSDEERKRRSGLSDEDIRMMLDFGYEDDLNRVLGYRTVRTQKYSPREESSARMDLKPFAYSGKEYDGSVEGRSKILDAYQNERNYLLMRLVLTGFCMLLMLICYLFINLAWIPILCKVLLPVFLIVTALLSHRTLIEAYKSLAFFSPTPHAIPALLLPIALVGDLFAFFSDDPAVFPIFSFIAAFVFLISAIGDLFRFSTERHAFLVLSAASPKIAPEPYIQRKKKLQRGEEIVSLIDDSPDYDEYRVRPVGRIIGFFRRCGNLSDVTRPFSILISLAFGLTTLGSLILWIFPSVPISVWIFVTLLFYSAPVSFIFAFFYAAGLSSRRLSRKRAAIIGEESIAELTRKKAMLFPDSKAFKVGKCVQIPLRNDSNFKEDLRLSGILFRKIGGILAEIATPLFPAGPDPSVSILRIREDGVEALVDNRYHILAGSRDYLLRYGIRFPLHMDEPKWQSTGTANLFVAIDDVLKLRYEVEYRRLESFDMLRQQFGDSHTAPGVFTYDPNLTEAFLKRLYKNEIAPILVKPGAFDEETDAQVTDAPAVTLDKAESIAAPAESAATIKKARKIAFLVQIATSAIGTLFATLLLAGQSNLLGLGALTAFHLFSLILSWGVVTFQFNHPHS